MQAGAAAAAVVSAAAFGVGVVFLASLPAVPLASYLLGESICIGILWVEGV